MSGHPLDPAKGALNGVLMGVLLWAVLLGFAALIYFNVHV